MAVADLPDSVKAQVLCFLNTNNFTAAKQLHDSWLSYHYGKMITHSTKAMIYVASLNKSLPDHEHTDSTEIVTFAISSAVSIYLLKKLII